MNLKTSERNYGTYQTENIETHTTRTHIFTMVTMVTRAAQLRCHWDNVSFHWAALVQNWFTNNPHFSVLYLSPYSPFLNLIEGFFSAWRWKVYDHNPHERVALLIANFRVIKQGVQWAKEQDREREAK